MDYTAENDEKKGRITVRELGAPGDDTSRDGCYGVRRYIDREGARVTEDGGLIDGKDHYIGTLYR